jgi:hypothetical protein
MSTNYQAGTVCWGKFERFIKKYITMPYELSTVRTINMMEALAAAALFWLGYFLGNAVGENSGYNKGWKDKEYGSPYKPPR